MAEAKLFDFAGGSAVVFSTPRPESDSNNQDSAGLIPASPNTGLVVVADGLGGSRAGDQASKAAIEAIQKVFKKDTERGDDLRTAILDGFEQANAAVIDLGLGAGTTLAVVEIGEEYVRPYHVGDSLIMIVSNQGTIKFQNVAHSPVGYAVESGILDEKDALEHVERHVVSNVVGSPDMHIEVGPKISLAKRDTLVVASDGLSDNFTVDEIVELVRKGPMDEAASSIVKICSQRMLGQANGNAPSKPDDLTFIAFRRNGSS
ncbi:MAG: serine/threonine-protein phosphatase [Bdellovibrionales bacterium]|nr:serine/threonine-protein phosphatase [Bdellovibrionales bacterium]